MSNNVIGFWLKSIRTNIFPTVVYTQCSNINIRCTHAMAIKIKTIQLEVIIISIYLISDVNYDEHKNKYLLLNE